MSKLQELIDAKRAKVSEQVYWATLRSRPQPAPPVNAKTASKHICSANYFADALKRQRLLTKQLETDCPEDFRASFMPGFNNRHHERIQLLVNMARPNPNKRDLRK